MPRKGEVGPNRGRLSVAANGKHPETRRKYIKPGTAEDGDKRLQQLKRDLVGMANDGYFDNWPDVKSRVLEDYNPLVELAIAGLTSPGDSQRIIANKIVAEFCFVPLAHAAEPPSESRAITIHIENYATGRSAQAPAAIEPPRVKTGMPALDVIASDREVTAHRGNSAPTPAPQMPQYQKFHVEGEEVVPDADGAIPRPVQVEPVDTEIIDSYGQQYRIKRRF